MDDNLCVEKLAENKYSESRLTRKDFLYLCQNLFKIAYLMFEVD